MQLTSTARRRTRAAILEMTAKQEEYNTSSEWVFDPPVEEHAAWTTIIFLLVCYTMVVSPIEMAFIPIESSGR